jgi:hypothetical protein
MSKRRRGFRNSVVVTFAAGAAAGCAQVNHPEGQSEIEMTMATPQPPVIATNPPPMPPPRPTPAGGGAGVAGSIGNVAGAKPPVPTIPSPEMCPVMPPAQGAPCMTELTCRYGEPISCSPKPSYLARCAGGLWTVQNNSPTCNPPPPPAVDDAGV